MRNEINIYCQSHILELAESSMQKFNYEIKYVSHIRTVVVLISQKTVGIRNLTPEIISYFREFL